jgi:hypothetical protein
MTSTSTTTTTTTSLPYINKNEILAAWPKSRYVEVQSKQNHRRPDIHKKPIYMGSLIAEDNTYDYDEDEDGITQDELTIEATEPSEPEKALKLKRKHYILAYFKGMEKSSTMNDMYAMKIPYPDKTTRDQALSALSN